MDSACSNELMGDATGHPGMAVMDGTRVRRGLFMLVNVVGGMAVLSSYGVWLGNPAHDGSALWGSLGSPARTLYTASMLAAAAGYFVFLEHLVRREIDGLTSNAFATLLTIFALILFPSALWMPLTFEFLAAPSAAVWWAMRVTLLVVAAASVALILFLVRLEAPPESSGRRWAVLGAAAFALQTAVLDAFIWPSCFPG